MREETDQYKPGQLVVSCKGHDRGRAYLVIAREGKFLLLADGRYRLLGNEKKKNERHVRLPGNEEILIPDLSAVVKSRKGSGDGDKAVREFIAENIKKCKENA